MSKLSYTSRQYKRKTYGKGFRYHIYNRGVAKQPIFYDSKDYEEYLRRLSLCLDSTDFELYFYCLMPNHTHIMVEQIGDQPTSLFVKKLHGAYSRYFNLKYDRVGALFQGRFKQTLALDDATFDYIGRYIHRNPVESGIVSSPEAFKWSSCAAYTASDGCDFITSSAINLTLQRFGGAENYKHYLCDPILSDTIQLEMLI